MEETIFFGFLTYFDFYYKLFLDDGLKMHIYPENYEPVKSVSQINGDR